MMWSLIALLLVPVALVWLLPLAADLLALTRPPAAPPPPPQGRPRLLVLVPAHNESLLIGDCVRSLMRVDQAVAACDVVVVADNCTDDTAHQARAAGARVLERANLAQRGKPWAIEWAMAEVGIAPYDAVVIVDADTVVEPGFAAAYAARGPLRDKAIQGYFGLSNEQDSWLSRLAGLLARVRYENQYPLKQRAGLNCPLTGNGMCLGTALLARAGWAPEALTENWELYARYTARGERIEYARDARLAAQEASTMRQSGVQRKRWQAGRIAALKTYVGPLLSSGRISLAQKVDALAELTAPGPILHVSVAVFLAAALLLMPGTLPRIVGLAFVAAALPMAAWTISAWLRGPDRLAIAAALLRLPAYAAWRIGVALVAVVTGRRMGWERSPRHSSGAS